MTTLFIRLENFTKPNESVGSRTYIGIGTHNNIAHLVGDYCKREGIDTKDCGMTIFDTKKAWKADSDEWYKQIDYSLN